MMPNSAGAGPSSHAFISQRLRLHYADWGNEGAPVLILVHGGLDHCRNWDWVAERLRDRYHIIAPDLRGHGDSQWSPDGHYSLTALVHDLAQLVRQQERAPIRIIGHSLGGNVAVRFSALYPERVARLIAIEGLGLSPQLEAERESRGAAVRLREWIEDQHAISARQPRRYATVDEALRRMQAENPRLSAEQARHLTVHGLIRNEDGSFSWKFDNYGRSAFPVDVSPAQLRDLWSAITCPTLLVYGRQSWASNPAEDGRLASFRNARVSLYDDAGHWVHHDRLDAFVEEARAFLA